MSVIYAEQENGNLKLVAEVEGIEDPALAVDALLDEAPRLQTRDFIVLLGTLEDGQVVRVTVDSDEIVQRPKRSITVTGNGGDTVEAAKPARKTRKPRQSAPKPAAKRGRKPAAKKPAGRKPAKASAKPRPRAAAAKKPAAKRGGSPFKRNAKSDE